MGDEMSIMFCESCIKALMCKRWSKKWNHQKKNGCLYFHQCKYIFVGSFRWSMFFCVFMHIFCQLVFLIVSTLASCWKQIIIVASTTFERKKMQFTDHLIKWIIKWSNSILKLRKENVCRRFLFFQFSNLFKPKCANHQNSCF